ncbi:hypothetical protein [Lutispora thermophila]|uniref:Cell division protein FtsL n=1 Tax=Lutispora thermophila DSM 19022 TaxID=1122184 RepID=A0A1M6CMH9_9FIRM|nr:hypothetical protein [Lutispora thermophila]SHI62206.1 hypothetical protein SAMN02745176_00853 [Lutispora thermophila DSM 19022]
MLVADNRAYDYSRENYINDIPHYEENKKTGVKKAKKAKQKVGILPIILVFSMSIIMISRYAYIAEINFNISKLEKEYKEILKQNQAMTVSLMSTINLQTLEEVALGELNMQYPGPDQIVYVSAAKPVVEANNDEKEYFSKEDLEENKYIAKAKLLINSFISLLD